jgi:threonyl-tRNA synthetase
MVGFLIEHYAGAFPVWLAPEQVRVIPITDAQNEYAAGVAAQLKDAGVRASADLGSERMNAKIRAAQMMKIPYMVVIGTNEAEAGVISLRMRDGSQVNNIPLSEFLARAQDRIRRRAQEL